MFLALRDLLTEYVDLNLETSDLVLEILIWRGWGKGAEWTQ